MSEIIRKRIFVCLTLCLLGGLLATNIATRKTAAQVSSGSNEVSVSDVTAPAMHLWLASHAGLMGAAATTQGATLPAEKTAEQAYKNIQVLKGLPASQMSPLMNSISTSLGVRCNFCHVRQPKDPKTGAEDWAWESDDKPAKQTARRMMQMTLSLNATYKGDFGNNAVTCYTCHRGKNDPVGIPSLPLAVPAHEDAPATPPAGNAAGTPPASNTLPSVEQIFSKYTDAVGGKAALAKLQTRTLKGTYEASQNRNFPLEVALKGTDKFTTTVTMPNGVMVRTIDGNNGWVKTPQGTRAMTPAEVAETRRAAQSYQLIKVSAPTTEMRVRRRVEKVGERDAYVVESRMSGNVERLYFDKETGLLLRKYTLTNTMLNAIPEQMDFEDYREVDGVKVPFIIRTSTIDLQSSSLRRFSEIKLNAPVDDTVFAMPAATPK